MNTDRLLGVSLACFADQKTAGAVHRSIDERLRRQGDVPLQSTVLRVDSRHRASVHDPRRALQGTLTAALTWGAFGLVAGTDRVESTIIWAVIGAVCGGLYAYASEHLIAKDELGRIGHCLAAESSALLTYALTDDGKHLLEAGEPAAPSVASAATIGHDLHARVLGSSAMEEAATDANAMLTMVVVRYPEEKTARAVAAKAAARPRSPAPDGLQIELAVETDHDGRRHVSDPTQGVGAMARSDVVSWGLFGVVVGAVAGLVAGGGILGFLRDGLVTGIGWAVFGLAAGALYGLWAGRSISARRLEGLGAILPAGSSALVAWTAGAPGPETWTLLDGTGSERLALSFNPARGGAVLGTPP